MSTTSQMLPVLRSAQRQVSQALTHIGISRAAAPACSPAFIGRASASSSADLASSSSSSCRPSLHLGRAQAIPVRSKCSATVARASSSTVTSSTGGVSVLRGRRFPDTTSPSAMSSGTCFRERALRSDVAVMIPPGKSCSARRAFHAMAAAAEPPPDMDFGRPSGADAQAEGSATGSQAKKKKGKSSGSSILFLLGCSGAALSIIYQDEIWEYLNLDQYDNVFDEFNHHSREFFMRVGDFLVPPPAEPWLLDFETLKYPPHLPTLVVDMDKVVCKLEYDRKQGWQVRKRPGADRFFNELQHYYEIVVFSDDVFPVAGDVMQKWGIPVGGVLHREFCQRYYKHFRKDISKLGRNLERVIHIDHDRIAVEKHPENAIVVPEYNPAPRAQDDDTVLLDDAGDDTVLLDLIDFLKAAMHQNDVREFLKRYGGDGDVGKRYLLEKQEREQLVAKRRSAFNFGGGGMARKRTDPTGRRF